MKITKELLDKVFDMMGSEKEDLMERTVPHGVMGKALAASKMRIMLLAMPTKEERYAFAAGLGLGLTIAQVAFEEERDAGTAGEVPPHHG